MTRIIAILLVLGQFEVAVETSKGYFVATYPDTEVGVTQFLHEIRPALETDPGRFYPCVVYDGPVRDLFPSPLADRIGLVKTLRTGLRDPGTGHHGPSLVRSDRIKTYLASHPKDRLDAKVAERICRFSFPPNYIELYPASSGVGEFYRRPRRRLTSRSRVGFETSRGTKELSNKPFDRADARRARRLSSGRRRRPLNGTLGRRRGEWSSRQIAHAPWITSVLAAVLFAAPLAAEAQEAGKVWQVGLLGGQSARWAPLREGLRELGYVEGLNISTDWRPHHGRAERLPDLAAELARRKVDVIVAIDNPATAAAQRATRTIPIVMVLAMDPVGTGFVGNLARPGGNVTGLSVQATELQGKALQLLKEAAPAVSRVAVIWDPGEPGRQVQAREAETSAHALGLQIQLLEVRSPAELGSVVTALARDRVDALLVHPSGVIFNLRARIAELASKRRLPTMGIIRWFPEAGGLMSYGAKDSDQFRRAAIFVDKILKGAKPADLPVEQPTNFELVINLKTAKALGLTMPQSLMLRADQVIE